MKIQTLLKFLNISRKNNNSSGFTLIELLVAAAISSLIIGVAGWGLVTLMGSKKASDSQSDKQGEINRASDFINDEIRRAKYINEQNTIDAITASSPTYTLPVSPGASLSNLNNKNIVLALQIPDTTDNGTDDEIVIYYVESVPNNSTTWRGPMVIRRWGPTFNANGAYNIVAGNLSYTDETLIDGIKATDLGSSFDKTNCPNVTPSNGFSGLYACLGGRKFRGGVTTNPYYTTAQLNINGVFKKATDSTTAYSGASDGSTQTVSRINDTPGNILSTLNVPSRPPSIGLQARFLCKKGVNGNPDVPWRVRTTIEIDGFKFSYLEGKPIDNLTSLINGSKTPDFVPPGKKLSDYKISKSSDGKTLQVEQKNSSGGYTPLSKAFNVSVEPYIVKDTNGNFVSLNGTQIIDKDTGVATPVPPGFVETNPDPTTNTKAPNDTNDNIANFRAPECDNFATSSPLVDPINNPNQVVTLADKGIKFPPDTAPYKDNVTKGFNGDKSTLDVLKESGYLNSANETDIDNDEMVFLFEIGHDKIEDGFDLQDKAVILNW